MSNQFFSVTNSQVLDKFQSQLGSADDSDAWNMLPLTDEEKHTLLMEESTDPTVKKLYAKIKKLRAHIAEQEAATQKLPAEALDADAPTCDEASL